MGNADGRKGGVTVTIVVVATDAEYELATKRFDDAQIVKTGVGGVNVYKTLHSIPKTTKIINFGYVGSNRIPVGTEVSIKECLQYHPNVTYAEEVFALGERGVRCYTAGDFVLETKITEPVVFDMELAYICALFPCVESIKIVSDTLSLAQYEKNAGGNNRD